LCPRGAKAESVRASGPRNQSAGAEFDLSCAFEKAANGMVVDADCTACPACGPSLPAATSNPTRKAFCNDPRGLASFERALAGKIFDGSDCVVANSRQ
jgi:hypothetical protein